MEPNRKVSETDEDKTLKFIKVSPSTHGRLMLLKAQHKMRSLDDLLQNLMERPQLYLGHLSEATDKWFVCWGETENDILTLIGSDDAEPEQDSLIHLHSSGYFPFEAKLETGRGKTEVDTTVILKNDKMGTVRFNDPEAMDWIRERIEHPIEQEKMPDVSIAELKRAMDLVDLFKRHGPACPQCGTRPYLEPDGCEKCGFIDKNSKKDVVRVRDLTRKGKKMD